MSAPVDRHRQAVYDAEEVAFGGTIYEEPMALAEAADLVRSFCEDDRWTELGLPVPEVRPTRRDSNHSYARCGDDGVSIHLSPTGCTAATIAHELAHVLVRGSGRTGEADHGPSFRRADVDLVAALLGTAVADRLAAAFAAAGLDLATSSGVDRSSGGFWASWRSARTLADAGPAGRGPIAL